MTTFLTEASNTADQVNILHLIHRLWLVCKNVFDDIWLSKAACKLLSTTIAHLPDPAMYKASETWSKFCVDLLSCGLPNSLDIAFKKSDDLEASRVLWGAVAAEWIVSETPIHYADVVATLLVPLQCVIIIITPF